MANNVLIQARKKAGLTQREIAERARITITGYHRYEKGLREPKVGVAIAISEIVHEPITTLFGHYVNK